MSFQLAGQRQYADNSPAPVEIELFPWRLEIFRVARNATGKGPMTIEATENRPGSQ